MNRLSVRFSAALRTAIRAAMGIAVAAAAVSMIQPIGAQPAPDAENPPIVLTGADMRPATSLNGDWATIADPYSNGFSSYYRNQKQQPGDTRPIEYDFAKSPVLKVPGDWNTQRESLLYYEGPIWYERDFTYQPKQHTHIFLHVGAANYRSWFWVNGTKVCEHEGGYTSFNCDVTKATHAGGNFVVAAVDNTRLADGVPTLKTDWWNYGGLTRAVSLIEVPEAFIDQYDIHLTNTPETVMLGAIHLAHIDGWVHVIGGNAGDKVQVEIPELKSTASGVLSADGRAQIHLVASNLERWSPETPKVYKVRITAGQDTIEDLIGFRTVETRGTEILLNGKPIFLRGVSHPCRSALSHRPR